MKNDGNSLTIGMKLRIEISTEDDLVFYPSQLLDIQSKDEFIISGPIIKNRLILIREGDNIKISYMIKDKGKHHFLANVVSRSNKGIYKLKIKKISEIKVIQDREHFRLSTNIAISKYSEEGSKDNQYFIETCETKDVSGGGMKIYSNILHDIGDIVTCSIDLFDEELFIKGKIVRIEEVDSFNYKYLIGLQFFNIDDRSRDMIIKYIFEEQRKLRLKGLI